MLTKKDLRTRRFVANYIKYLTVFGYLFVAVVGIAIAVLWFVKTDEEAVSVGDIVPREQALKRGGEVVVLNFLVSTHTDVKEGQGLVEISSDPVWVERYRFAKPEDPEQLVALRSRIPDESVEVLAAPISGAAVVWKEAVGRILPAGWDIAKVIDFADLRISAEFAGTNVTDIRAGQQVRVEPLITYGNRETLLSDVAYPGWWRKGRAQFNSAGDGKVKEILKRHYAGSVVTLEKSGKKEDTPFTLSEVTKVDLLGVLRVTEPPLGEEPKGLGAEPFVGAELPGIVLEATHTASVRIRDLPDEVLSEIKQVLLNRFGGGVQLPDDALSSVDSLRSRIKADSFLDRFRSGLREDDTAPLSVQDIEDLKVVVTMDAEHEGSETVDGDNGERDSMEQTERNCRVVTRLTDPPQALQAKVRALAFAGGEPARMSVVLKVVVGKRRIAMLLFRKN